MSEQMIVYPVRYAQGQIFDAEDRFVADCRRYAREDNEPVGNVVVNALNEQFTRRWISCVERLPEATEGLPFLVTFRHEDGEIASGVSNYSNGVGWWLKANTGLEVIAWQPLPNPYAPTEGV